MYFHWYHWIYVIDPTVAVGTSGEAGPSAIPVATHQGMPCFDISQWQMHMLCYRHNGPIDGQVQMQYSDCGGWFNRGWHAHHGHWTGFIIFPMFKNHIVYTTCRFLQGQSKGKAAGANASTMQVDLQAIPSQHCEKYYLHSKSVSSPSQSSRNNGRQW